MPNLNFDPYPSITTAKRLAQEFLIGRISVEDEEWVEGVVGTIDLINVESVKDMVEEEKIIKVKQIVGN